MTQITDDSPYIGPGLGGFAVKLSLYARENMFKTLVSAVPVNAKTKVLDVGVTSDRRVDCNFFERLYPFPENITAVGTEDASFLEEDYPGLRFIKTDGRSLPFQDNEFDLVVSFAVLEHVGNRAQQKAFIQELCRVGQVCFITTPNRWFPVEFHTGLPLLHWLPVLWFRKILTWIGQDFWSDENNLNLLSEREFLNLVPLENTWQRAHFKLLGMVSNLILLIK